MQQRRFALNNESVPPVPAGSQPAGFVPCPAFLWAGLTWEQRAWRHWVYQRALASAQAAFGGDREFKAHAAAVPRAWRN